MMYLSFALLVMGWMLVIWVAGRAVHYRDVCRIEHEHLLATEKELLDLRELVTDSDIRHDKIEADLREQLQNMAERLATLRVEKGAVPEQDRFEEKPEPPKPYAEALRGFLDSIEYSDARVLVEEDIESYRNQGYGDEQILEFISEG